MVCRSRPLSLSLSFPFFPPPPPMLYQFSFFLQRATTVRFSLRVSTPTLLGAQVTFIPLSFLSRMPVPRIYSGRLRSSATTDKLFICVHAVWVSFRELWRKTSISLSTPQCWRCVLNKKEKKRVRVVRFDETVFQISHIAAHPVLVDDIRRISEP